MGSHYGFDLYPSPRSNQESPQILVNGGKGKRRPLVAHHDDCGGERTK